MSIVFKKSSFYRWKFSKFLWQQTNSCITSTPNLFQDRKECWSKANISNGMATTMMMMMMTDLIQPEEAAFSQRLLQHVENLHLFFWLQRQHLLDQLLRTDSLDETWVIDMNEGCHEQLAVKAIHESSMSRNSVTKILNLKCTFKSTGKKSHQTVQWQKQRQTLRLSEEWTDTSSSSSSLCQTGLQNSAETAEVHTRAIWKQTIFHSPRIKPPSLRHIRSDRRNNRTEAARTTWWDQRRS